MKTIKTLVVISMAFAILAILFVYAGTASAMSPQPEPPGIMDGFGGCSVRDLGIGIDIQNGFRIVLGRNGFVYMSPQPEPPGIMDGFGGHDVRP
ncbi:MAG: hypothetical protein LBQ98_07190 [Nitrososphaerota archaeon]|jgi:hypothetical protein|nr:hypothetical protein [Nitrososphaerota archaeon]